MTRITLRRSEGDAKWVHVFLIHYLSGEEGKTKKDEEEKILVKGGGKA